jgi:hypothetical protein
VGGIARRNASKMIEQTHQMKSAKNEGHHRTKGAEILMTDSVSSARFRDVIKMECRVLK